MKLSKDNNVVIKWLFDKRFYFLAFFIPSILMYAVYAAFKLAPFGDGSVLVLDLNGQYVYYYEALRDAVWNGHSLFYSWSRNLGGEFVGIFGYYLASPFSVIPAILPRTILLYSLEFMLLAKVGTASVTFFFYLRNSKKIDGLNAVIFSVLYSMMMYMIVQLMNPMWIDGVIYLPLIIYGVEMLIDEGKLVHLIIPLALLFLANFYIGWMVAAFTTVYFFVYLFLLKAEPDNEFITVFRACRRFFIAAIISGACAAVILLPVFYSLQLGKMEFTTPNYTPQAEFTALDFLTKLFPMSYDTVRNEGLPFVYCGVLTLLCVPLYFLNAQVENRKKTGNAILIGVSFLFMYISTTDIFLHGMQVPNWLPYRFSFMFSFFLLIVAAVGFSKIEGVNTTNIGVTFFFLLLYLIFAESKEYGHFSDKPAIWFSIACLIAYAVVLFCFRKYPKSSTVSIVVVIITVGELFGSTLETLRNIDKDVLYSKYSSYVPYADEGREMMSKLYDIDNSFYRTEKTYHRTVNDSLAFGMKGLSHSSSTLNAGVINFLDKLGYASRGHYVKYSGSTYVTDAVLGIKYVAQKDNPCWYDKSVVSVGDATVYENPNALSVGFMADDSIKNLYIEKGNPFTNQNELLSYLVGDDYQEFFKRIYVDDTNIIYENVQQSFYGDMMRYTPIQEGLNAHIEFLIDTPTDDIVYMYLPCYNSGYERAVNVWVNHEFLSQYYETENYTIKTLGRFSENETVSLITTITKDEVLMNDQWFYYLDEGMFKQAVDKLKENQWNITKYSDTYLEGTITADEGQVMFTSIPYEPGWTVKVDGVKTDYFCIDSGLIGIDLEPGEHTVTMSFFPRGLAAGIVISGIGISALIFVILWEIKKKKFLTGMKIQ